MTDELKALVEVAKTVSGDARGVLMWWLGYQVFQTLIGYGTLVWFLGLVVKFVGHRYADGHITKKIIAHMNEGRDAFGGIDSDIDRAGSYNDKIHRWVDERIAEQRAKKGKMT